MHTFRSITKIMCLSKEVDKNRKRNTEFIGITEVTIDVHLLDCRVGCSMGWHGTISCFVRIIGSIKVMGFLKNLQLFNNTVGVLRIIFRNPCFNTGGTKAKIVMPARVGFSFGISVQSGLQDDRT